jgi:hypothetical protein
METLMFIRDWRHRINAISYKGIVLKMPPRSGLQAFPGKLRSRASTLVVSVTGTVSSLFEVSASVSVGESPIALPE